MYAREGVTIRTLNTALRRLAVRTQRTYTYVGDVTYVNGKTTAQC